MNFFDFQVWVKENFHKPIGLIVTQLLVLLAFLGSVQFDFEAIKGNLLFGGMLILVELIVTILWFKSKNKRRCPMDKVGVVFAILERDANRYDLLKYNLIDPVMNGLNSNIFYVQALPYHLCKQVKMETAKKFLNETNSEMLIFGRCNEGKRGNEEKFEIYLNCLIKHAPLNQKLQEKLQTELTALIPRRSLDKRDELTNYELTAHWLIFYSKYFMAVAELLSRNLNRAEEIFRDMRQDMKRLVKVPKEVWVINKKINSELFAMYLDKHQYHYASFRKTKDLSSLEIAHNNIIEANQIIPETVHYLMSEAIHSFLKTKDTKRAKDCYYKIKRKMPEKYFGLAFLSAYDGDLIQAMKFYKKAFRLPQNHSLPIEVEEFIEYILELEPEKYHLHLCLALINDFKGDHLLAKEDLDKFLLLTGDESNYDVIVQQLISNLQLDTKQAAATVI